MDWVKENNIEILTEKGFKKFDGFLKTKQTDELYEIEDKNGNKLKCTEDHKIKIDNKFIEVSKIKDKRLKIKKNKLKNKIPVYDAINVEDTHSYYTNNFISHNCLMLDEFAFVPHGIAQDFLSAVMPTISASKTARVVIISTPNGLNHFYKFCIDAKEKRNDYVYFEVPWYDIPGRDENWKLQTIRNECNNDLERFKQEYECEFNAGSETLIESAKIKTLAYKNPIKEEIYKVHNKTFHINIYEESKKNHIYIMPVDSAKGGGDSCAFHIIDVTTKPFKQVVAFREDKLSHLDYPEIILKYAKMYNNAFIIVENNEIGQEVADKLWYEYEYENLWNENDKKNVGFRTTTKSKRIGMSTLKGLIENDILILNDFNTISELSHFKKKGTTFKGDGDYDDLTMALVFFSYFTTTVTFDDLITHGVDITIQKQMEENEGEPDIVLSDYDDEEEFMKMFRK